MSEKTCLAVGINHYSWAPVLKCAVSDAQEVAAALAMQEYSFDVETLLDDEATTEALGKAIVKLFDGNARLKLAYLSGHGHSDDRGTYLCVPQGSHDAPGISLGWLKQAIERASGTVVVVLDCCHAGAAQVKAPLFKSMSRGDMDRAIGSLSTGKMLIAACAADEVALECDRMTHGLFTHYLLEGLLGPAANQRGIITPTSLYDYVAGRLEESRLQTPVLKGEILGLVVLGHGFPTNRPLTPTDTGVDLALIGDIEKTAANHMDDYLKQTAVPYHEWKTSGFKKASQLLQPVLRWFERQLSEYPELASCKQFSACYGEAHARLAQLGAISEGTLTDEGEIVARLGSGAFGTVWKVQAHDHRPLAYKVFHSNELQTREKVVRFEHGYRAMNQLDHPNVVKVHKYTTAPLGFYMDFVDGPNLREFSGTLTEPADVVTLLIQVAETLQHAHGRNVIHRDVKPENVLVTFDPSSNRWVPYLTDFDLAWFTTATQVTKEGFGAFFYAAPEQLAKPTSHQAHAPTADVYAFGQLSFFVACGSDPIPFGGADNKRGLADRIGNWPTIQSAEEFLKVYVDCTQMDPGKRPQSFRVICDRLFEIGRLLGNIDARLEMSQDQFVRELLYVVAGLSNERQLSPNSCRSVSGRTIITVDPGTMSNRQYVTVQFNQEFLSYQGATYEGARHMISERVGRALAGYPVTRRSGHKGAYEIFLDIHLTPLTLSSVDLCRQIVTRAVDAMEAV